LFLLSVTQPRKTEEKRGWSAGACPWAALRADPRADQDGEYE
jgi:hypothetical protein